MANIYFYHTQSGQQNVDIISVTTSTSEMSWDYENLVEFLISSGDLAPRGAMSTPYGDFGHFMSLDRMNSLFFIK